jgi:hypothetical protein
LAEEPETRRLKPYTNKTLVSATGKMDVLGELQLNKCIINGANIESHQAKIIVANELINNQCLLGRDIMNLVPEMKYNIEAAREVVKKMSPKVEEQHRQIK